MKFTIEPFSDQAIYISFGDDIREDYLQYSQAIIAELNEKQPVGYMEAIPGYNNITIFYDSIEISLQVKNESIQMYFMKVIEIIIKNTKIGTTLEKDTIRIPVCYGRHFGVDLSYVAQCHNLTTEEVIKIHSEKTYMVHMLGFAPGFPFLGGMDPKIATPRKSTPEASIPAGSVGIAGIQTGIYPLRTPGGWQIIGRTPIPLFKPDMDPPALIKPGNKLEFYSITEEEYLEMEERNYD